MKFYKANIIYVMTVLFGACAGGLMMGINFFHMGKKGAGWSSIILSVLVMTLVMLALILAPAHVCDAIPKLVIPLIFGVVTYLIVDRTQQRKLQEVAEKEGAFYSNWKSLGTGLIGGVASVAIVFAIVGVQAMSEQKKWDEIAQYENEALKLYTMIDQKALDEELGKFIENIGLADWDKFLGVVAELESRMGITKEELAQMRLLKDYGALRKVEYQYILDITRDKLDREDELARVQEQINLILRKLSAE